MFCVFLVCVPGITQPGCLRRLKSKVRGRGGKGHNQLTPPAHDWRSLNSGNDFYTVYNCLQCLTLSYIVLRYAPLVVANRLWKWLANSPSLCRTVLGTVLEEFSVKQSSPFTEIVVKQFSPFMELLVQLCLTTCATVSYYLCKWLASSSPIYGNGFRSSTSENQRLHKELSSSENRVT
jgi:hypothetical protein